MIRPIGTDSEYERSTTFTFGAGPPPSRARSPTSVRAAVTPRPMTSGASIPGGSSLAMA